MSISQIIESLKAPTSAMSIGDKMVAGGYIALLSMGIVFIILVIICLVTNMLKFKKAKAVPDSNTLMTQEDNSEDMNELVAIITATICELNSRNPNTIIVKKITRSNNYKSNWECMQKSSSK